MIYDKLIVCIDGIPVLVDVHEFCDGWDRQRNIMIRMYADCPLKDEEAECRHPKGGVFCWQDDGEDCGCPLVSLAKE